MRSGRAVSVLRRDLERLPDQELLDVQVHRLRPLHQLGRDEDRDARVIDAAIRRQVLALEVGVDRHLGFAVSSERRDEVECHRPAALLSERDGLRR